VGKLGDKNETEGNNQQGDSPDGGIYQTYK
jgi:hypothetical protein